MNKDLLLPFSLLVLYIARLLVFQSNVGIAESIVVAALCGLYSFIYFRLEIRKPDPSKELQEEMAKLKNHVSSVMMNQTKTPRAPFTPKF